MTRTEFQTLALPMLAKVSDAIEELPSDWDAEQTGEILNLTAPDGRVYVLSLHMTTLQLWYASPVSGAWHFEWKEGIWQSTRGAETLVPILEKELGIKIA